MSAPPDLQVTISEGLWTLTGELSHILFGMTLIFGSIALFQTDQYIWLITFISLYILAWKEFWYDQTFESAQERGSNYLDWIAYAGGFLLAIALYKLIAPHFMKK